MEKSNSKIVIGICDKTRAFFRAFDDGRMKLRDARYYRYIGQPYGKDLFVNKITGVSLD